MTRPDPTASPRNASRVTRTLAVLVLIPGVPMLLASVATLILFYLAPDRLTGLLARLPGQEVIRTLLFFAPVTLFAVVILAVLYAREGTRLPPPVPPQAARRPLPFTGWLLWVSVPLLLASGVAWAARFLAPGRFQRALEALPGTSYLQRLVSLGPPLLLAVVAVTLLVHVIRDRPRAKGAAASWSDLSLRLAKLAAVLVLLPSVPLLLLSSAGLALYYFEPDLLLGIAAKLSQATVLRLGVLVLPISLLALIFLATLTLMSMPTRPTSAVQQGEARKLAAVAVLVAGLMGTMVAAVGVVGAVIWLLLR